MKNLLSGVMSVLIVLTACKTPIKMGSTQLAGSTTDSFLHITGITHSFLADLLKQYPQYFGSVLSDPQYKVQIIYTRIDRKKNQKPEFTDFYFNVNDSAYFYPASTVKLPVAILALQKLKALKIAGLDRSTTMITEADYSGQTEVYNDPTAPDGRPTIAHYIKKILLVSDNDAFNRLYEFLGQEYINSKLHKMGYQEVQIVHRLEINMTEDENRHTNPIRFYDTSSRLVYEKPLQHSKLVYAHRHTKPDTYRVGNGFYRNGELINEPFDFSKKNQMSLRTLHNIVRTAMFPERMPRKQRFRIPGSDYDFLRKYMSMTPLESKYPFYDRENYWNAYVKYLLFGTAKSDTNNAIRSFNKPGKAYGFLIDAAYFADFDKQIEFILSAVIHCNSDGILNDDKYDYETVGLPFMKHLGEVIYDHEVKRTRKITPDLSKFRFNYDQ